MLKMFKLLFLLLLIVSSVTMSLFVSAAAHQYDIEIDESIAVAAVKICFDGEAPDFLTVDSKYANRDLLKLPESQHGLIEIQGRYWKTKYLPNNACLSYRVSIERHHAKRTKKTANKRKNVAYIESNTWLWLPEAHSKHDDIKLSFKLPKWAAISAPWYQTSLESYEFLMGHQPQDWGYTLLIGDFSQQLYPISPGHYLNIATVRGLANKEEITRWLVDTAQAVERYLGDYPVKQTQVIVIEKTKQKHGPVPWGDFSRGNGFGIRFVIVPSYEIKEFYADWTATHEFSHQLLPKLNYDDIWLSEGLSSYLQYVLMGQAGTLEIDKAWYRIYKGLKRGEKGTENVGEEKLKFAADRRRSGGRAGRTMRIYWSGAAYFLNADLQLRKQSNGKVGLNDILLKLNQCCVPAEKIWTGAELAKKLDELAQSNIFLPSYWKMANSAEFPDYKSTFSELGISLPNKTSSRSGRVKLQADSFALAIMQ